MGDTVADNSYYRCHWCADGSSECFRFYFQSKRLGALNKFKSKDRSILIATDVASRGLDIPHVDVVINFDIPTHSKVKRKDT